MVSVGAAISVDDFASSAILFYMFGFFGMCWCACHWALTSSTPEWHPQVCGLTPPRPCLPKHDPTYTPNPQISLPEVQYITKER